MKVKDIIKKQTTVIAIAVVLVAATVIGVSYAIFFDVKSGSQQVITAGTLKMTITGIDNLADLSEPVNNTDGLKSDPISYTVQNTASDVPATYQIYVYGDEGNQVGLEKIRISLDGTTSKPLTDYPVTTISGDTKNYYKISGSQTTDETIAAGTTAETKKIRLWLDEDKMTDADSGLNVRLSLYIISEVD